MKTITKQHISALLLLIVILLGARTITFKAEYTVVYAGSSSSGDIPPPGGGGEGDTSGGSAAGGMYLNYRIPLIFRSGPFGPSIITITALQNQTPVIFGFYSHRYESNTTVINFGEKLILDPSEEPELENGSLIQSFAPLQINVFHNNTAGEKDNSFAYSVLVMSMWGRIYQCPFDNARAMIVAGFNGTELTVSSPNGTNNYFTLGLVGSTIDVRVSKGTVIEANGPIGVVFYSLSLTRGSFAYMGIPYYLWGTEYYLYPHNNREGNGTAIDNSYLVLTTPEEYEHTMQAYTNLEKQFPIEWNEDSTSFLGYSTLDTNEYYTYIYSLSTNYSVVMLYNQTINNYIHLSAFQYISKEKMRWAELFFASPDYSRTFLNTVALRDNSTIYPIVSYEGQPAIDLANITSKDIGGTFSYTYHDQFGFIGNGTFFTFLSSINDYNIVDATNLLYPLNLYSYFENTSTYFPSWYRFPNLNVREVKIFPPKPTELRTVKLDIIVQNNGTIPSAPFWVTVLVNDTLRINKKLDGLDINQTFSIPYKEFRGFGLVTLNVSIYVDSFNQIMELQEFDNVVEIMINISRNWNVIYTGITIAVVIVSFIIYKGIKRIQKDRRHRSRKFDLLLSEVEV